MPRCRSRVSPPSSSARMYLARRAKPITRRPTRRSARRSGSGKRRSGRRCTSAVICRPLKHAALRGDRIELMLPYGLAAGQVNGEKIEGTIDVAGRGKLPFTATRTAPGRAVGWPD